MFSFKGDIISSKSWLNRMQIIRHFNPQVQFELNSDSDDVVRLNSSLSVVGKTNVFDLGQGGTTLRFFIFLISRYPGTWILKAHPSLLARPQHPLKDVLSQLGVECSFGAESIEVVSREWQIGKPIICSAEFSSQFISGLLLSAWNLNQDLTIKVPKPVTSFEYLKMTLSLLQRCGMTLQVDESETEIVLVISKKQRGQDKKFTAEPDVSSAFSLAAAAVVNGYVEITNWNSQSLQPDICFLEIFKTMNISFEEATSSLKIAKHNSWKPIKINLQNSPDLFPVLSVLCAMAEGVSELYGAAHLKVKESDRIAKTQELLKLCGYKTEEISGGLRIFGQTSIDKTQTETFEFDPSDDHRMAMAAGLLKLRGFALRILQPESVNKSYPNFWKDIEL